MIRYTATSTNVRKDKIINLLNHFLGKSNPVIENFGIKLGTNFIKVHMRILPPPSLEYYGGKIATTFKGSWRMEHMQFLKTTQVPNDHKWAIIYEKRAANFNQVDAFKKAVSLRILVRISIFLFAFFIKLFRKFI